MARNYVFIVNFTFMSNSYHSGIIGRDLASNSVLILQKLV